MIPIGEPRDIGETIVLLRTLQRLTQRGLAAASGVSQAQVTLYETGGTMPGPANTIALLAALGHGLAIVPLDASGPETALSATKSAEQASGVDGSRCGDSNGSTGHTEALALLRQALHLRTHGERAPGGGETWADWDRQAETLLRAVDQPAGVVLVDDGSWTWRWTPTDTGSYSGPHGPDICSAIGCQHEGGAA